MRSDLAIIAAVISIVAALPYIIDTLKGKTHPNAVTWLTWTLINGINAVAAWSSGATQTAIFSTAGCIGTSAVFLIGLKLGLKRYTRLDMVCQAIAMCSIVLWRITGNISLAIAISLVADFAGFLPTYVHALRAPHAETWQTFAINIGSSILTLLSIQRYTFIALASPGYICLANLLLVGTILFLRKRSLVSGLEESQIA